MNLVSGPSSDALPRRPIPLLQAATRTYPGKSFGTKCRRASYVARSLVHGATSRSWLSLLSDGYNDALWRARPRLGRKLQRAYLHRTWTRAQALAALQGHYGLLGSHCTLERASRLYTEGVPLLRIHAASHARSFLLKLGYSDSFDREGELTLSLIDSESSTAIASATFTLFDQDGVRTVWIGGAHAGADAWVRALAKMAMKELYGIKAKSLVVWAVREVAKAWKAQRIVAVADGFSASPTHRRRQRQMGGDNGLWQELGGSLQPDGAWELPLDGAREGGPEPTPGRRRLLEARAGFLHTLAPHILTAVLEMNRDGTLETRTVAIAGTGAAVSPFLDLAAAV